MNARMRECLEAAVGERLEIAGPFSERLRRRGHTPASLFSACLAAGAEGFKRSTIWRALELATEEETTDAPR